MEKFLSIIIILFGILQVILFFKIWVMTNDVRFIKKSITNSEYDFIHYMLLGEKEKAFNLIKLQLFKLLISFIEKNRWNKTEFIDDEYVEKAELTGYKLPSYLQNANSFWNYYDELDKL